MTTTKQTLCRRCMRCVTKGEFCSIIGILNIIKTIPPQLKATPDLHTKLQELTRVFATATKETDSTMGSFHYMALNDLELAGGVVAFLSAISFKANESDDSITIDKLNLWLAMFELQRQAHNINGVGGIIAKDDGFCKRVMELFVHGKEIIVSKSLEVMKLLCSEPAIQVAMYKNNARQFLQLVFSSSNYSIETKAICMECIFNYVGNNENNILDITTGDGIFALYKYFNLYSSNILSQNSRGAITLADQQYTQLHSILDLLMKCSNAANTFGTFTGNSAIAANSISSSSHHLDDSQLTTMESSLQYLNQHLQQLHQYPALLEVVLQVFIVLSSILPLSVLIAKNTECIRILLQHLNVNTTTTGATTTSSSTENTINSITSFIIHTVYNLCFQLQTNTVTTRDIYANTLAQFMDTVAYHNGYLHIITIFTTSSIYANTNSSSSSNNMNTSGMTVQKYKTSHCRRLLYILSLYLKQPKYCDMYCEYTKSQSIHSMLSLLFSNQMELIELCFHCLALVCMDHEDIITELISFGAIDSIEQMIISNTATATSTATISPIQASGLRLLNVITNRFVQNPILLISIPFIDYLILLLLEKDNITNATVKQLSLLVLNNLCQAIPLQSTAFEVSEIDMLHYNIPPRAASTTTDKDNYVQSIQQRVVSRLYHSMFHSTLQFGTHNNDTSFEFHTLRCLGMLCHDDLNIYYVLDQNIVTALCKAIERSEKVEHFAICKLAFQVLTVLLHHAIVRPTMASNTSSNTNRISNLNTTAIITESISGILKFTISNSDTASVTAALVCFQTGLQCPTWMNMILNNYAYQPTSIFLDFMDVIVEYLNKCYNKLQYNDTSSTSANASTSTSHATILTDDIQVLLNIVCSFTNNVDTLNSIVQKLIDTDIHLILFKYIFCTDVENNIVVPVLSLLQSLLSSPSYQSICRTSFSMELYQQIVHYYSNTTKHSQLQLVSGRILSILTNTTNRNNLEALLVVPNILDIVWYQFELDFVNLNTGITTSQSDYYNSDSSNDTVVSKEIVVHLCLLQDENYSTINNSTATNQYYGPMWQYLLEQYKLKDLNTIIKYLIHETIQLQAIACGIQIVQNMHTNANSSTTSTDTMAGRSDMELFIDTLTACLIQGSLETSASIKNASLIGLSKLITINPEFILQAKTFVNAEHISKWISVVIVNGSIHSHSALCEVLSAMLRTQNIDFVWTYMSCNQLAFPYISSVVNIISSVQTEQLGLNMDDTSAIENALISLHSFLVYAIQESTVNNTNRNTKCITIAEDKTLMQLIPYTLNTLQSIQDHGTNGFQNIHLYLLEFIRVYLTISPNCMQSLVDNQFLTLLLTIYANTIIPNTEPSSVIIDNSAVPSAVVILEIVLELIPYNAESLFINDNKGILLLLHRSQSILDYYEHQSTHSHSRIVASSDLEFQFLLKIYQACSRLSANTRQRMLTNSMLLDLITKLLCVCKSSPIILGTSQHTCKTAVQSAAGQLAIARNAQANGDTTSQSVEVTEAETVANGQPKIDIAVEIGQLESVTTDVESNVASQTECGTATSQAESVTTDVANATTTDVENGSAAVSQIKQAATADSTLISPITVPIVVDLNAGIEPNKFATTTDANSRAGMDHFSLVELDCLEVVYRILISLAELQSIRVVIVSNIEIMKASYIILESIVQHQKYNDNLVHSMLQLQSYRILTLSNQAEVLRLFKILKSLCTWSTNNTNVLLVLIKVLSNSCIHIAEAPAPPVLNSILAVYSELLQIFNTPETLAIVDGSNVYGLLIQCIWNIPRQYYETIGLSLLIAICINTIIIQYTSEDYYGTLAIVTLERILVSYNEANTIIQQHYKYAEFISTLNGSCGGTNWTSTASHFNDNGKSSNFTGKIPMHQFAAMQLYVLLGEDVLFTPATIPSADSMLSVDDSVDHKNNGTVPNKSIDNVPLSTTKSIDTSGRMLSKETSSVHCTAAEKYNASTAIADGSSSGKSTSAKIATATTTTDQIPPIMQGYTSTSSSFAQSNASSKSYCNNSNDSSTNAFTDNMNVNAVGYGKGYSGEYTSASDSMSQSPPYQSNNTTGMPESQFTASYPPNYYSTKYDTSQSNTNLPTSDYSTDYCNTTVDGSTTQYNHTTGNPTGGGYNYAIYNNTNTNSTFGNGGVYSTTSSNYNLPAQQEPVFEDEVTCAHCLLNLRIPMGCLEYLTTIPCPLCDKPLAKSDQSTSSPASLMSTTTSGGGLSHTSVEETIPVNCTGCYQTLHVPVSISENVPEIICPECNHCIKLQGTRLNASLSSTTPSSTASTTLDNANTASTSKHTVTCGHCKTRLSVKANATTLRCPQCRGISQLSTATNPNLSNLNQNMDRVTCFKCNTLLAIPKGAKAYKCMKCGTLSK